MNFNVQRARMLSLGVGILGIIACAVGAFITPASFFSAWLIGYLFWAGIALGSLSLILLHHLVGGNWGFVSRRVMEAATRTMPLLAVLLIPILFGIPQLYRWATPGAAHVQVLRDKAGYLNVPFFITRLVTYFVLWFVLTWILNKWSSEQDETASPDYIRRFRFLSGPALIVHVYAVTFLAFDLLMSLEPEWYSTIFGAIILIGQVLSALALCIACLMLLQDREPLAGFLNVSHFHDLGNLLFTFVIFWAYVSVSQLIIIWSANLPEEVRFYVRRSNNGWEYLTIFLAVFHFVVPFLILLNRFVKKRAQLLTAVALGIAFMRLVDLFWLVQPALYWKNEWISWLDFVAPVGIGGLWLAFFFWQLERKPLLPLGDMRFVHAEAPHA
jgi:hypothetical protein